MTTSLSNKTTLLVDGGLGRLICAIPALEKFIEVNSDSLIVSYFWTPILFGNKKIHHNIFDNNYKNLYTIIKDTKIVRPEPYYNSEYLNGKISLSDAFNQEINGSTEKMPVPKIFLSSKEKMLGKTFRQQNKKMIAFQPFGSSANFSNQECIDQTARSMNIPTAQSIVKRLKEEGYNIFLITDKLVSEYFSATDFVSTQSFQPRDLAAIISNCDYYLGIDSAGQHIARCFDVPGTVLIGGTNARNISYPEWFNIYDVDPNKKYMPYRLCEFDSYIAELENSDLLNFNRIQADTFIENAISHLKSTI